MSVHIEDRSFEEQLRLYEDATVRLLNLAPSGSAMALQAIDNLRECLRLREKIERRLSGQREGRGRRLSDYYPEAQLDRHHVGAERRKSDRRASPQ
ncbi:MAG TPA: hypothetical protein VGE01_12625 [Fimbriimonas sp.]